MEFMFVTDDGGTTYHVPLTYRAAPPAGSDGSTVRGPVAVVRQARGARHLDADRASP